MRGPGLAALGAVLLSLLYNCAQSAEARIEHAGRLTAERPLEPPRRPAAFVSAYSYEHFVRAELAMAQGQHRRAVLAYERVASGSSEDTNVLSRLARAYAAMGEQEAAQQALARALELDPHSEAAWLVRGELLEARGDGDGALLAYARAARGAPDSPEAASRAAALLQQRGQPQRATQLLLAAAADSPGGSAGQARLRLRAALAAGDGPDALVAALQLRRLSALQGEEVRETAALLLRGGDPLRAWALLEAHPPDPADAALRLQAALGSGRHGRALALLTVFPAELLGGPERVALAELLVGRPQRALQALEPAGQEAPHPVQLLRARALLDLARCDTAAELSSRIPPRSAVHGAARDVLREALACAGLAEVAAELP